MSRLVPALAALSLLLASGCGAEADAPGGAAAAGGAGGAGATGGSGGAGGGATGGAGGAGATAGSGGAAGAFVGRSTLISVDWTVPAGEEPYLCARATLPHDLWVTEYHPVIPAGSHHTVVTIDNSGEPDGVRPCHNPFEGAQEPMIYGTGVGSVPLAFPAGVATHLPAGTQILLNLHLYNVGTTTLTGTSAIEVVSIAPAAVVHEARNALLGPTDLDIPPGVSTTTKTCPVVFPVTLVVAQPHMHQLGSHFRARLQRGGADVTTLWDAPWAFEAQEHQVIDPGQELLAGDSVVIDCTYDNPGASNVFFGESSTEEMCFLGVQFYPPSPMFCF